jgi:hypothetical protein
VKTFHERAAEVGNTAVGLITGDRAKAHGHAFLQHQCMADLWTTYLGAAGVITDGRSISPLDASQMLMLMKVSRNAVGAYNPDTFIDQAGYACLSGAIAQNLEEVKSEG